MRTQACPLAKRMDLCACVSRDVNDCRVHARLLYCVHGMRGRVRPNPKVSEHVT